MKEPGRLSRGCFDASHPIAEFLLFGGVERDPSRATTIESARFDDAAFDPVIDDVRADRETIRKHAEATPDKPAYVFVRDAEAAAAAIAAGTGSTVTLCVGGKLDNVFNRPVTLAGTVEFAGPASFRFWGEGYTGVE